jgi:hypothetical protein
LIRGKLGYLATDPGDRVSDVKEPEIVAVAVHGAIASFSTASRR